MVGLVTECALGPWLDSGTTENQNLVVKLLNLPSCQALACLTYDDSKNIDHIIELGNYLVPWARSPN